MLEKIAGKIGELALEEHATKIDLDLIIRGYIIASPKRDHKFLRKKLCTKKEVKKNDFAKNEKL